MYKMNIHAICIWSFLALLTKERLGYYVQGSLSINFSLLSCQNKEFGSKYFLFLSQTYFCAKDKRILNLPKAKQLILDFCKIIFI
jgi:hypothetical protein